MSEPPFDPVAALRVLSAHGVRFVIIGGYAAAIRGSPVITGDLDICYSRDRENLHALAEALRGLTATLRGAPPGLPFQLDEHAFVLGDRFTLLTSAGRLDCMATAAGISGYDEIEAHATEFDLDGLRAKVASLDDLIRMKRATGRPKDLIGLEWLAALREETENSGG